LSPPGMDFLWRMPWQGVFSECPGPVWVLLFLVSGVRCQVSGVRCQESAFPHQPSRNRSASKKGKRMKQLVIHLLDKMPYTRGLWQKVEKQGHQIEEQRNKIEKQDYHLEEQRNKIEEQWELIRKYRIQIEKQQEQIEKQRKLIAKQRKQVEKQGAYPAGHYYSPIPEKDDVLAYVKSMYPLREKLPDIDLNEEGQFSLLNQYTEFYGELPFPENREPGCRYYYDNGFFSYSDAIFLYSFLRKNEPKRIIEVGSGFSSAVILDTVDRFFSHRPEITFIEPYPARLETLLRRNDKDHVRIIDEKIQDVSLELFSSLESGDFLFIDSSHIVKCGSDLQYLFFKILPGLPAGIFVHFHDVFYPFDYPYNWLKEGRYWNENYFLHAFLSYNFEWRINFFNTHVATVFNDFIKNKMPLCARNKGGSLYIQRRRKGPE